MLKEKLARARAEYGQKLEQRLAELTGLARQARGADRAALDRAQQLAHRLCGTAGSFGFGAVSEALADVDRELLAMLAGGAPDDEAWTRVEAALGRATGSVAR